MANLSDVLPTLSAYARKAAANVWTATQTFRDIEFDTDGTRSIGTESVRAANVYTDKINGGALSGFRNRLMNPAFQVDIEGNAGGVTSAADYVVEGWQHQQSNDVTTMTASRVTDDDEYALQLEVTTGSDTSIGSSQYSLFHTAVEGYDIADAKFGTSDAKSIWVSGSVKAPTTGVYCVRVTNAGYDRSYVFEVSCTANTWVDFEKEIPGDTTGTWDSTNGVGLVIGIPMAFGDNWETTADTWGAGNYWSTSNQENGLATNGNQLRIKNWRLSVGGPIPFEHRPYALEHSFCNRYYEYGRIFTEAYHIGDTGASGDRVSQSIQYRTRKRTTPTISTTNNAGTGTVTVVFNYTSGIAIRRTGTFVTAQDVDWYSDARLI